MKSLVIISCFFIVATIVTANKNYRAYAGEELLAKCAKESELTQEEIIASQNDQIVGDKHKIGCMHACILRNMKVLKDAEINSEVSETIMEEMLKNESPEKSAKMKTVITDCIKEVPQGLDECGIGLSLAECTIPKLKELE